MKKIIRYSEAFKLQVVRELEEGKYDSCFHNLIKDIEIIAPNQAWCSDITYIRTGEGFMYASLITDMLLMKNSWSTYRGTVWRLMDVLLRWIKLYQFYRLERDEYIIQIVELSTAVMNR